MKRVPLFLFLMLAVPSLIGVSPSPGWPASCQPTPWDEIGPFYRPNAPQRSKIGTGYLLNGTVRSSKDCSPIRGARIEVWQTDRNGKYDDAHRATLISDSRGRYRLETDFPGGYAARPSHIHILVDARGYQGLVTQHYPMKGGLKARFDLVLEPEDAKAVSPKSRTHDLVTPGKKP